MDLDELLIEYFGGTQPSRMSVAAQARGVERLQTDFRFEQDRGRRFALWALMHMLGVSPAVEEAFDEAGDIAAAYNFKAILAAGQT